MQFDTSTVGKVRAYVLAAVALAVLLAYLLSQR
jgi:hypothetical protein